MFAGLEILVSNCLSDSILIELAYVGICGALSAYETTKLPFISNLDLISTTSSVVLTTASNEVSGDFPKFNFRESLIKFAL